MSALGRRSLAAGLFVVNHPASPDLPPEAPLAMPVQSLWRRPTAQRQVEGALADHWRGALLVAATIIMTVPAVIGLGADFGADGIEPLEVAILAAFTLLFAWIAFAFTTALAGFLIGDRPVGDASLHPDAPLPELTCRTAILLPTYNEAPQPVMARIQAMIASLRSVGAEDDFDIFVLSDTTKADIRAEEYEHFRRVRQVSANGPRLYYRHRPQNIDRKAGNVGEWVRRFGGAYEHMVVLDADSLMAGETLVRLAAAMERNPAVGLIQTVPVLVNLNTLLARAQQFATRLYGPMLARGLAWWSGAQGNYWGHNAIIRTCAFAEQAGLPSLPGRKPFGGHIMSHDFVEAALLRRAGWEVRMAPHLGGSFEESPPNVAAMITRDRRWCQGNLQHLMVLPGRGLHWISRMHLLRGAASYLTSPLWLLLVLMGLVLSLKPEWAEAPRFASHVSNVHPQHATAIIFAVSMVLLLAPKALALIALAGSPEERRGFGGARRAAAGVAAEMLLSALLAPVLMLNQVRALISIVSGRDSGWNAQVRGDGSLSFAEAARGHVLDTAAGLALGAAALAASLNVFLWLSPMILGLVAAIPLAMVTARQDVGARLREAGLLVIPEESRLPALLERLHALSGAAEAEPETGRGVRLVPPARTTSPSWSEPAAAAWEPSEA
jgi:membrane glycosyltransferase